MARWGGGGDGGERITAELVPDIGWQSRGGVRAM